MSIPEVLTGAVLRSFGLVSLPLAGVARAGPSRSIGPLPGGLIRFLRFSAALIFRSWLFRRNSRTCKSGPEGQEFRVHGPGRCCRSCCWVNCQNSCHGYPVGVIQLLACIYCSCRQDLPHVSVRPEALDLGPCIMSCGTFRSCMPTVSNLNIQLLDLAGHLVLQRCARVPSSIRNVASFDPPLGFPPAS